MDNQIIKNLSLIFIGVALTVGASLILNHFSYKPTEPPFQITNVLPKTEEKIIEKQIAQKCECNTKALEQGLYNLARKIEDFPHGITEKGLQSAVQKAFERRPCITYKELEKHFVPNSEKEEEFNFD